jgi:hypothetical protein
VVSSCPVAITISGTWLPILLFFVCCYCCSWFTGDLILIGGGNRLSRRGILGSGPGRGGGVVSLFGFWMLSGGLSPLDDHIAFEPGWSWEVSCL